MLTREEIEITNEEIITELERLDVELETMELTDRAFSQARELMSQLIEELDSLR